jgi:hypothetical protein
MRLWMPLDCAKRGKFVLLNSLRTTPRGLSTAFQQLLWKMKRVRISVLAAYGGLLLWIRFRSILKPINEFKS